MLQAFRFLLLTILYGIFVIIIVATVFANDDKGSAAYSFGVALAFAALAGVVIGIIKDIYNGRKNNVRLDSREGR